MEYLLKIAGIVTIFYIIYKLFLARDTFFESNRWFLLIGLISSLVIPFIVIPIYTDYTPVFYNIPLTEHVSTEAIEKPFSILNYLPLLYGIGVAFFAGRFFIQLLSLIKIIYKNRGVKKDQFIFIETRNNISPFSFFKWIVYNPETFSQTELEHIIEHEKTHAKQYHSVDILITQLFCILLWFNPFMWLYNKDLKQNLEFIADKYTLNQYQCKKSYQYTLLKTSMPSHHIALSNHFYNSLIKKRIVMLHKSKSKKINQLKYALIFPALLGFLISCNSEVDSNPDNHTGKDTSSTIKITGVGNTFENGKEPLFIVDGKEITNKEFESLDPNSISSVNVLKGEHSTKKHGDKGKNGVVEIVTKENAKSFEAIAPNDVKSGTTSRNDGDPILIVIDGKEMNNKKIEDIDQDNISSVNVLKGESATKKYGDKGKNGVIEITTKSK